QDLVPVISMTWVGATTTFRALSGGGQLCLLFVCCLVDLPLAYRSDGASQRRVMLASFAPEPYPWSGAMELANGWDRSALHDVRVLVSGVYRNPFQIEGRKPLPFNGVFGCGACPKNKWFLYTDMVQC